MNTSAPFTLDEYSAVWKNPNYSPWGFDEYKDFQVSYTVTRACTVPIHLVYFQISNTHNQSCTLPQFGQDDGTLFNVETNGCMESDFDQYGDMEAFGVHPDWQRQLSKFASVQDRLREWKPSVMARLQNFACMAIQALDIDAIRIDKSTQVTVSALADWASSTRSCASNLGKKNFFIPGEVTGGDSFGSLY
jgi:alpha-1,3-glucan synthase